MKVYEYLKAINKDKKSILDMTLEEANNIEPVPVYVDASLLYEEFCKNSRQVSGIYRFGMDVDNFRDLLLNQEVLINDSQELIQNIKPEFLNEEVVRETNWQTVKSRSYAKGWNACSQHYMDAIKNIITEKDKI